MRYTTGGINDVTFEVTTDGRLIGTSTADSNIRALEAQNQQAKGVNRTMKKCVVPYSYTGPDGGIKVGQVTYHDVVSMRVPENPAEKEAQIAALDEAIIHLAGVNSQNASTVGQGVTATNRIQVGLLMLDDSSIVATP